MLEVSLRHDFGSFSVDVDFTAPKGVTALFGASGAGKTTVVNAVAGLFRPAQGRITAEGVTLFDTDKHINLPPRKRRVGYVFQEPRLFPHMSVRSNLLYGARFAPRDATGPDFDAVIGMLGIGALLDRRPGALSGGEKSRVSLGRALLSKPRMLLMDEPLAALDAPRREEILPFLESLRDAGMPVLLVSHSIAEVARLASTVVLLSKGRVIASGPTGEILSDPALAPRFGAGEAGAIITAHTAGRDADGLIRLETAGGPVWVTDAPEAAHLRLRIQASDVILSREAPAGLSALNVLTGTIRRIEEEADGRAFVQIAIGDEAILSRVTLRSVRALGLAPGVACHAIVKSVAVSRDDLAEI
ncbi:molybdenum ABC transporter ATP-binding protein [Paenirhodobacter populi]|uniref:Molybdenum ABC transporter ATP-binding protein n=1 Tax=Paenirhodobacter populi TaxID=2306993 RepID=A0A443J023_9RHOB|nr:molybdenum ABC transporter ATP-binding protein [Sinirhodobacter populi]RWR13736.1 molybdenum ABC transporter ATP-binding protein [Sinirhodobacter populi]RWR19825.1 molybdenum ABC transporter ATP-binding protein [Sinirhodobacter populi]